MDSKTITFLLILITSISCKAQESIDFHYLAQTRGFKYEIKLENNKLVQSINSEVQHIILSNEQLEQISKKLKALDLENLKTNIDSEKLAVDAMIKGTLDCSINKKDHYLEFNHNNLPKSLANFLIYLESLN